MHRLSSAGLRWIAFALTIGSLAAGCTPLAANSEVASLEVTPPPITLNGLDTTISVRGSNLHGHLLFVVLHLGCDIRIAQRQDAQGYQRGVLGAT